MVCCEERNTRKHSLSSPYQPASTQDHYAKLLLQSADNARVLFRQGLSLLIRDRFRYHVEKRPVGIWQHQHPLLTEIDFNPVNGLSTAFAVLFAEDAHHFTLVFPAAVHHRLTHEIGRQVIYHL